MPLYIDIGDQFSSILGHNARIPIANSSQKTIEVKKLFRLTPFDEENADKGGKKSVASHNEDDDLEVEANINFSIGKLNRYDKKGLYGMTDERVYDPNVVALRESPPSRMKDRHLLPNDQEYKTERDYINNVNNQMSNETRCQTCARINTVGSKIKQVKTAGTKGSSHSMWVQEVKIEKQGTSSESASSWRASLHASGSEERNISHHYCDALGPDTCSECSTYNVRRKSYRAMRSRFPDIDTSAMSLVAPRYAKLFRNKEMTHCRYCDRKSLPSQIDRSPNTYRLRRTDRPSRFGKLDIVHQRKTRPRDIHPTLETSDDLRHEREKTLPYIKYKQNNRIVSLPNVNVTENSFLSNKKSVDGYSIGGKSNLSCKKVQKSS
ncbi:unnamed protein product [Owenia fusiformis]|uniref:Uncharacterized protein n=1 Tax=Owenia fusiformis TaxID=6347 RepID=A0A8S4NVS2_OWEFU|nr:unnamed protein product [Owenia fusiformis]